jgi:WxcM-like, C-terminal
MRYSDPHLIPLPAVRDPSGALTAIEGALIPFEIKRVFYLYDVPGGAERGGHAHFELEEVIIAVSGSFDVVTWDGSVETRYHLNRSNQGLYLPPSVWRHLDNFSGNSVALILASTVYTRSDYLTTKEDFEKAWTRFPSLT